VRHGDVRPVNVLIGHDGRVVLTDFGTAPLAADPAFAPGNRRMQAYLAPERKDTEPTPAADLWSLGATLHYAVTGTPPDPAACSAFAAGNRRMQPALARDRKDTDPTPAADLWSLVATLLYAVTGTPPDPAARSHDEVPVPLRPVVNGLLARDPKKRLDPQEA